VFSLSVIL